MFTDNVGSDLQRNARQPTSGAGHDLGLRFILLGGRVNANLIRFDNTAENYATNISTALQTEVNEALNTGRTTPSPDLILGTSDSNDRTTQGWELELTANPTRNWTTRLAFATTEDFRSASVPQFRAKVQAARTHLASLGRSATEIDAALAGSDVYIEGQNDENRQPRRYRGSFVTPGITMPSKAALVHLWYTPPSCGSCMVSIQRRFCSASSSRSGRGFPDSGMPVRKVSKCAGKSS